MKYRRYDQGGGQGPALRLPSTPLRDHRSGTSPSAPLRDRREDAGRLTLKGADNITQGSALGRRRPPQPQR
ncbi:MAG TPA: hypothetical protein PLW67_10475 [Prolixibacteraceae bacterium]|nr:hypothetical protein [Prolixibacteraceae bacterium]